jgi:chemotaxis protein MotB
MKSAAAAQPIIVKKVKKHGHGHHGGAWKVALADFVTAMMAFFLLLWLLGSTTEEQKQGISDYFLDPAGQTHSAGTSTVVIDMGGGFERPSGKGENPDQGNHNVASGDQVPNAVEISAEVIEESAAEIERMRLEDLKRQIEEAIEAHEELKQYKDQLLLDITSEGLRIQILDKENRPMFDSGSTVLKPYTQAILHEIVDVITEVPNRVSLTGHTDQTPYASTRGYTNWELSADRANAARRELVAAGLDETKIGRVVGLGSSVLFDAENPTNPVNRRISIVVMNKATEAALSQAAGPSAAETAEYRDGGVLEAPAEPVIEPVIEPPIAVQ